jgi:hypothetical protein
MTGRHNVYGPVAPEMTGETGRPAFPHEKRAPWSPPAADAGGAVSGLPRVNCAGGRDLASGFWWFIHSERTGSLQVDAVVAGLGLAGALLCELAPTHQIVLVDDRLQVAPAVVPGLFGRRDGLYGFSPAVGWEREPGPREPDAELLRLILSEPRPLSVRDWLAFLSRDAHERVARRMLAAGLVRTERVGRLRRRTGYPPVDQNVSGWAAGRLRVLLERAVPLSRDDLALIGLCKAVGVDRHVFAGLRPDLVDFIGWADQELAGLPRRILTDVRVAVGAAVVHRP